MQKTFENIEEEMADIWYQQMNGDSPNPHLIKFPGDGVETIFKSSPLGLLAHSVNEKVGVNTYLRLMYINPTQRGMKWGTGLIQGLKQMCIENNIFGIEVETENDSEGFFLKQGFMPMENEVNRMILNFG